MCATEKRRGEPARNGADGALRPWPQSMWRVPAILPSAVQVRRLLAALQPEAPVRIGLIGNQSSRRNLHSRLSLLGALVPEAELVWQTRNAGDLVRAVNALVFEAGVNVLAVAGGDGTLHHTVNLLVRLCGEIMARDGAPPELPAVLVMPGGTMNVFARAFGTKDVPLRAVARFRKLFAGRPFARLSVRRVGLLDVRSPRVGRVAGFVLGSPLVLEALRVYEGLGAGYAGLMRFLAHATAGRALGSDVWRNQGHRISRDCGLLRVDTQEVQGARAFVASTIPLTLLRGSVRALDARLVHAGGDAFASVYLPAVSDAQMLATLPALLRKLPHRHVVRAPEVYEASFDGPFTVDGELFPRWEADEPPEPERVEVHRLGMDVPVVRPDWQALAV